MIGVQNDGNILGMQQGNSNSHKIITENLMFVHVAYKCRISHTLERSFTVLTLLLAFNQELIN